MTTCLSPALWWGEGGGCIQSWAAQIKRVAVTTADQFALYSAEDAVFSLSGESACVSRTKRNTDGLLTAQVFPSGPLPQILGDHGSEITV